jgi:predicted nucleic acid-binding protein
MIVVSDNSPLQYLLLIGCVDVLPALYKEIVTTPEVIQELRHPGTPQPVREWLDSMPPWLTIESPKTIDFLDVLDLGEASADLTRTRTRCQLTPDR